ncbi:MAG: hypothetical protein KGI37_08430 [Alphaproteobacteria bacterium]|nr:hypothetical protein [Alphaproteobacteria bacterium]
MNPVGKMMMGIGLAIAFVIVVAAVYLYLANAHLHALLADARADGTACHAANDDFAAAVARQNDAVAKIERTAQLREEAARNQIAAAREEARADEKAADAMMKRQTTTDRCKAADALLDDYIKDGK